MYLQIKKFSHHHALITIYREDPITTHFNICRLTSLTRLSLHKKIQKNPSKNFYICYKWVVSRVLARMFIYPTKKGIAL